VTHPVEICTRSRSHSVSAQDHFKVVDVVHEIEDVAGKKVAVKGGGVCVYCGWDGGEEGLHDEHVVPYSLGGNTELLNASCKVWWPASCVMAHAKEASV
jgi:5-methylcytosine-specific restriction endonuclease McrA